MKSSRTQPITEKWVINASPVIALARVGQVELLKRLPERVVIPQAVARELRAAPEVDPARRMVESDLFKIIRVSPVSAEILAWDLGSGETEVLAYALAHPGWVAILDDGAARRCARSLSVTYMGTLSVVILAKQRGLIESAAQVLHNLHSNGFHLDDAIIREALARTVKEPW